MYTIHIHGITNSVDRLRLAYHHLHRPAQRAQARRLLPLRNPAVLPPPRACNPRHHRNHPVHLRRRAHNPRHILGWIFPPLGLCPGLSPYRCRRCLFRPFLRVRVFPRERRSTRDIPYSDTYASVQHVQTTRYTLARYPAVRCRGGNVLCLLLCRDILHPR